MDDYEYDPNYQPSPDIMCLRADVIIQLALAADAVDRPEVRRRLLATLDNVLRSIDLPRGKLVEIGKTVSTPSILKPVA